MDFNRFILNEEIIANGKSLDDDDDKKNATDYTADKPDPEDTKPADDVETPPAAVDTVDNDPAPNYTDDNPDPEDTEPTATASDDNTPPDDGDDTPDYTADKPDDTDDVPDDGATPEDTTPDTGTDDTSTEDDDATPDYTADAPEANDDTDTTADTAPAAADTNNGATDGADTGDDADAAGDGAEDDDGSSPDYTSDSPEDDDATGDGTDATDGDDASAGSMTDDEIKQLETDLFSDMSPEQIAIKQTDLKTQFVTLYGNVEKVIDRLSKVNRIEDNIRPIEFVTRKLLELKDLVRDSLIQSYDTRSYVENQIILQRHMAIFATLTNIMEELGKNKK